MPWYEPAGRSPPSASIYCRSRNNQQPTNHGNRGDSPYLSQLERMMQDPLSRRLMSLISPMLPSDSLSPFLSKKKPPSNSSPFDAHGAIANGSTSEDNNASTSVSERFGVGVSDCSKGGDCAEPVNVLSPFPHPSFLHREAPISMMNSNFNSNGANISCNEFEQKQSQQQIPDSDMQNCTSSTMDSHSNFNTNGNSNSNSNSNHGHDSGGNDSEYRYYFYPRIVTNQPLFLQDSSNNKNSNSSIKDEEKRFDEYGNDNNTMAMNLHNNNHHNHYHGQVYNYSDIPGQEQHHQRYAQQQPHHYDHTYDSYSHNMMHSDYHRDQQQHGIDYYPELDDKRNQKKKKQSRFVRNNDSLDYNNGGSTDNNNMAFTSTEEEYNSNGNHYGNSLGITTKPAHHEQNWDQVGHFGSYRQGGMQYDDVIENQDIRRKSKKKRKRKSKKRQGEDYGNDHHGDHCNDGCNADVTDAVKTRTKKKRKGKTNDTVQGLLDIRTMMSPSNNNNDDDVNDGDFEKTVEDGTNHNETDAHDRTQKHNDNDSDFQSRKKTKKKNAAPANTATASTARGQRSKKTRQFRNKSTSKKRDIDSSTAAAKSIVAPIPYDTIREFVENYNVLNAGSNTESLREFLRIVKSKKYVSWTMIFQDLLCTTPNFPSSKKYCTEKGPQCIMWNCTCDNQIRAMQASAPLLGAMFVLLVDDDDDDDAAAAAADDDDDKEMKNGNDDDIDCDRGERAPEGKGSALQTFILPLAPTSDPDDGSTKDIDHGYERMANWPFLPIACDTTLQQRWEALRSILTDRYLTCVTFNAQATLMPYHYHCANDVRNNNKSSYDSIDESETFGYLDLILPNIWDLRLASWMLSPHATEEDLELENKMEGFRHLLPKEQNSTHAVTCGNASKQYLGLSGARKQLEFLYIIYPVINKLLEENGLLSAFSEIETPVQSVLSSMEVYGMGFKPSRLLQIQSNIEAQLEALSNEAQNIANDSTFSLSSPQQVSSLLYDKLGLEVPKRGPTSKSGSTQHRSTSEEMLKLIQKEVKSRDGKGLRIIEILLEFRSLSKILNTYIRPYPKLARANNYKRRGNGSQRRRSKKSNSESMKMYPMWMQTAVRTGRLSCRKPNIQQIPTGNVLGVSPRNAFVASSTETCLFACDYSQNEVRILAHMSGDESLISLFVQPGNVDIYKQMSSIITGKSVDSVSSKERSIAKQVTLAIIYGMGINNVAKKLSISKGTAQDFFRSFYGRFRGVKTWMEKVKIFARKEKYVTTITGRRRYLDNIDSTDQKLRAQAERQAVNTIIQGSAADLVKLAMLKMAARITDWRTEGTGVPPKLLLQIHDELVFEVIADETDVVKLKTIVTRCCTEECVEELQLKVPLTLTCSVGTSWGNMKDL